MLSIATKTLRQDSSCSRIVYSFRSFAGYHMHLAIIPVWNGGSYQKDYTIQADLVKDTANLRKENIEKVVSYKQLLKKKINSYLQNAR